MLTTLIGLLSTSLVVGQVQPISTVQTPPTFQDMLDSAQIVVIAKVDSMWYSVDERGEPWTNVSADLLTAYVKNDSLPVPKGSIHLAKSGGICPDGSGVFTSPSPSFEIGETFLTALREHPTLSTNEERIFQPYWCWKYTITNDSIYLRYGKSGLEPRSLSLAEVITALSSNFIEEVK